MLVQPYQLVSHEVPLSNFGEVAETVDDSHELTKTLECNKNNELLHCK